MDSAPEVNDIPSGPTSDSRIDRLTEGLASQLQDFNRGLEVIAEGVAAWYARIAPQIRLVVGHLALTGYEVQQSVPENLRGIGLRRISSLADLAARTGIAVAWAIPVEVLEQLLDCDDPASVLLGYQDEIVDHCETLLARYDSPSIIVASDVVAALSSGHWSAAQSLASNLIDSILVAEHPNRKALLTEVERPTTEDEKLRDYMAKVALLPVIRAFRPWYPGDPPLSGFSRHASAHAVYADGVATESNALVATCLAVSLTAQFEQRPPTMDTGVAAYPLVSGPLTPH